jgi:hypothetical protein
MTSAGVGLNKFCYAGLIAAHKNKTPIAEDVATKVTINNSPFFEHHFLFLSEF